MKWKKELRERERAYDEYENVERPERGT